MFDFPFVQLYSNQTTTIMFRHIQRIMKRVVKKFKIEFNWLLSVLFPKKIKLAIFDKFYPDLSYSWRTAEINYLLSYFKKSVLFSESTNYKGRTTKTEFIQRKNKLLKIYSDLIADKQIKYLNKPVFTYNFKYDLVYFLFLEDAVRFYPYLNRTKTPFAFTLYPGGGFILYNEVIDEKIKLICNAVNCQGVFVNGKFAYTYLTQRLNLPAKKVILVSGVPLYYNKNAITKKNTSNEFKIGFCARKYHMRGMDKGFDIFCQVALQMTAIPNTRFICIGDFSTNDMLEEEKDKATIEFKGQLQGYEFKNALSELDVIISPVRSLLNGGDFDGFPTAAVVEASLLGVTMVCSDPMNDSLYKNGEEIIILNSIVDEYVRNLIHLYNDRELCISIGTKGQIRTMEIYDDKNTLIPKVEKINDWLYGE